MGILHRRYRKHPHFAGLATGYDNGLVRSHLRPGAFLLRVHEGDPERPYHWGFSQPQWISLSLIGAVVLAELAGTISLHPWHLGAGACLAVTRLYSISLRGPREEITRNKLLHPRHLHGSAEAIQLAAGLAVERCDICKQLPANQDIHRAWHLSRKSRFRRAGLSGLKA